MSTVISAGTTTNTAYNVNADTSGTMALATGSSPTTAVYIDGSQNVGIGTSSPVTNLTISSASAATGGDGLQNVHVVYTGTGTTNAGYTAKNYYGTSQFFQWNNNGTRLGNRVITNAGGGNLVFTYGNDSEGGRFDSSGNLLVGTTSAATTTRFASYQSTAGAYCAQYKSTKDGSNNSYFNAFYNDAGSLVGYIVTANQTGTNYTSVSDYRLKENVAPMTGALSKVAQLKPVTYKWKESGTDGQGFIAHELQEVCPDAVTGQKDAVDAEGNPVYQGIDTSFLVATLTAAIQELNATITDLQAKLKSAGVAGF